MNSKLPTKGLYAITPDYADANMLYSNVEQALLGGIALLQYRDKVSSKDEKINRAKALHTLCKHYAVPLIINDNPRLALACNAEGVHLGQSDGSVQASRELLGENAFIGVTCHHNVPLAVAAQKQGADYVAFGRFFNSTTKPDAPLASIDTLNEAKKKTTLPIVAIGGITLSNASPIIEAGADYVAVVEGVFSKSDTRQACQAFSTLFL